MGSPLGNAIEFFREFGLFDIVLPFLLVFTIIFALLEKTHILGKENDKTSKKNLNSMVAFVVALLVVATNKVVTAINSALPNIVLLIVVLVSFLMLMSVFAKTGELDFQERHKTWYKFFVALMVIGVFLVFLAAIPYKDTTWLGYAWTYAMENWEGSVVSSFIILIIAVVAIGFVTKGKGDESSSSSGGG